MGQDWANFQQTVGQNFPQVSCLGMYTFNNDMIIPNEKALPYLTKLPINYYWSQGSTYNTFFKQSNYSTTKRQPIELRSNSIVYRDRNALALVENLLHRLVKVWHLNWWNIRKKSKTTREKFIYLIALQITNLRHKKIKIKDRIKPELD